MLICHHSINAKDAEDISLPSEWRITRVVSAPWAESEGSRNESERLIGHGIRFAAESVEGPGVLHCDHPAMEKTSYGAEGMFQGNLPKPANAALEELGIGHLPRPGVRLICSTGLFEFHYVDPDTMLTALDNQILTLSRSGGTQATESSPEGRIQRFLELHFGGDMGFTPERANAYRDWLSRRLERAVADYFAKPASPDEVPAVDGDPFTDSQSYPTRFSVGQATVSGDHAEVPIRFSDAFSDRTIVYVLLREGSNWQLDDVRFDGAESFANLLR